MKDLIPKFKKFFLSGVFAALINFAVYHVFFNIWGVNYLLSGIVAFSVSFVFAFSLHRNWSFVENKNSAMNRQLVLYFLVTLLNLICTLSVLYFLVNYLYLPPFISYVFSAGSITVLSFLLNNFLVFTKDKNKAESVELFNWLLISVGIAIVLYVLRSLLFADAISTDTTTFIDTAKYFTGDMETAPGFRLLKPLAPICIAIIHTIVKMDYLLSLQILVFLSYIFLAVSAYFFFYVFFNKNKIQTLSGVVLTLSAYPILKYGLDPMTEAGAVAFVFLAMAFATLYNRTEKIIHLLLSVFVILVGFLWKEYTALAGVYLFLLVVFKMWGGREATAPVATKNFYKDLFLVVFVPAMLLLSWHFTTSYLYNYTYLDWFKVGQSGDDAYTQFTIYYLIKSFVGTILLGWIFAAYGFFFGILFHRDLQKIQKKEIFIMFLLIPLVFTWGFVSSRLFFPVLIPFISLASYGLYVFHNQFGYKYYLTAISLYIFITFFWIYVSGLMGAFMGN